MSYSQPVTVEDTIAGLVPNLTHETGLRMLAELPRHGALAHAVRRVIGEPEPTEDDNVSRTSEDQSAARFANYL